MPITDGGEISRIIRIGALYGLSPNNNKNIFVLHRVFHRLELWAYGPTFLAHRGTSFIQINYCVVERISSMNSASAKNLTKVYVHLSKSSRSLQGPTIAKIY